jgi:hypothetical protein
MATDFQNIALRIRSSARLDTAQGINLFRDGIWLAELMQHDPVPLHEVQPRDTHSIAHASLSISTGALQLQGAVRYSLQLSIPTIGLQVQEGLSPGTSPRCERWDERLIIWQEQVRGPAGVERCSSHP